MSQNQKNDAVGDNKAPPLEPDADALRLAADQGLKVEAQSAPLAEPENLGANVGACLANKEQPRDPNCVQTIWFSFFFDGTGNNMDADIGTLKHSNVVRLYRTHEGIDPGKEPGEVSKDGKYRLYLPGVGTYFKEVHDEGGTKFGLAFGAQGDKRLTWAQEKFDAAMKWHIQRAQNPQNYITAINISAFGFSRGAAEARAFIRRFVMKQCRNRGNNLFLKTGDYPVYIKFMGLFDTVASVGLPMSNNNIHLIEATAGTQTKINARADFGLRAVDIAFSKNGQPPGTPGSDPAPGLSNGHDSWGDDMLIPDFVEQVQHFIAAHEIRNSFPVDSVSISVNGRIDKESQFHETVYPGVHSDVGGSYRPGEEGRSATSDMKIGLIALNDMYNLAIAAGVLLKPKTAWECCNEDDFKVSQKTIENYNYYLKETSAGSTVGDLVNVHMGKYYAWRFRDIRLKKERCDVKSDTIDKNEETYKEDGERLDQEIADLTKKNNDATNNLIRMNRIQDRNAYGSINSTTDPALDQANVDNAEKKQAETQDNLLRAMARKDALPKSGLNQALAIYDAQLIADAESIYEAYLLPNNQVNPAKRAMLRPHYLAMMTAYENEFIHNKGLTDEKIIAFFDDYVHDSLAGFAQDATLPSDPRVIYLGGDEKYQYALLDDKQHASPSVT